MKMQWHIYQALELIPDANEPPTPNLLDRLIAPLRRSFANAFVRDLSHKHQILLLKRCLNHTQAPALNPALDQETPSNNVLPINASGSDQLNARLSPSLTPEQAFTAQHWRSRGRLPWWAWYDR